MRKEGQRHYSDQPGHKARSQYWENERRVLRQELKRRKEQRNMTNQFSRLIGHEVLLFEPSR
jgi:hypothetical protein